MILAGFFNTLYILKEIRSCKLLSRKKKKKILQKSSNREFYQSPQDFFSNFREEFQKIAPQPNVYKKKKIKIVVGNTSHPSPSGEYKWVIFVRLITNLFGRKESDFIKKVEFSFGDEDSDVNVVTVKNAPWRLKEGDVKVKRVSVKVIFQDECEMVPFECKHKIEVEGLGKSCEYFIHVPQLFLRKLGDVKKGKESSKVVKVAFVVGMSEYVNFEKLKSPVNDVKAISEVLCENGFIVSECINEKGDGLYDSFEDFLYSVEDEVLANPNSDILVFFYFCGHGIFTFDDECLLPIDFDKKLFEITIKDEEFKGLSSSEKGKLIEKKILLRRRKISNKVLTEEFVKSRIGIIGIGRNLNSVLCIDACRNTVNMKYRFAISEGKRSEGCKTIVSYSTKNKKHAKDVSKFGKNSPYCRSLVKNLKKVKTNSGFSSLVKIFHDVSNDVKKETKNIQEPIVSSTSDVVWPFNSQNVKDFGNRKKMRKIPSNEEFEGEELPLDFCDTTKPIIDEEMTEVKNLTPLELKEISSLKKPYVEISRENSMGEVLPVLENVEVFYCGDVNCQAAPFENEVDWVKHVMEEHPELEYMLTSRQME